MEGLNLAMKTPVDTGVFDEIKLPNSIICLSHLFYADDTLLMGEWSRRNIANLASILRCFYVSSREYEKKHLLDELGNNHCPKKGGGGGGIGTGSIKALNLSLVTKWLWKLKNYNSALLAKMTSCLHRLLVRHWTVFEEETSDDALLSCHAAKSVLESILSWCEMKYDNFTTVKDTVLFISRWSRCRKKQSLLNVIICGALGCILTARNKWIFDKVPVIPTSVVDIIKAITFT
uniref:Reverse transcriptase domain-containing protein n=1 Tax=Lactuca sativa TaxID=4236 RepID=A0A9R1V462_LACSA|nr:hypothetical protein LSAT_V11C600319800 [Lactuca sativa]